MLKALWSGRQPQRTVSSQSEYLLIEGFNVCWRKSARRTRTLSLKLDRQGQLIVMTPMVTRENELKQFVVSRADWILRQVAQHQQLEETRREDKGRRLWLMGEPHAIEVHTGGRNTIEFSSGSIQVSSRKGLDEHMLDRRLSKWLRDQSVQILPERVESLSERTGLHGSGLQIKSYRARWGSCRHDGLIQLNWKLIKTPLDVIDYVIVHELSHLQHFDHSPAFWQLVARHCPAYRQHRQWLKNKGRLLLSG